MWTNIKVVEIWNLLQYIVNFTSYHNILQWSNEYLIISRIIFIKILENIFYLDLYLEVEEENSIVYWRVHQFSDNMMKRFTLIYKTVIFSYESLVNRRLPYALHICSISYCLQSYIEIFQFIIFYFPQGSIWIACWISLWFARQWKIRKKLL